VSRSGERGPAGIARLRACRVSADPLLDRNEAPFVVLDAIVEPAILTEQIAHLVHRAHNSDQFGREPYFRLRLSPLETIESHVGAVQPEAYTTYLVADALENFDCEVGRLYGPSTQQGPRPCSETHARAVLRSMEVSGDRMRLVDGHRRVSPASCVHAGPPGNTLT
jgi:hypothetical protein